MRPPRAFFLRALAALLPALAALDPAAASRAQEPPPDSGATAAPAPARPWNAIAELSYVVTAGNAETSTLGFKSGFALKRERSGFELKAGAVRAESTLVDRIAVGPDAGNFIIVEDRETTLTAENYLLAGRYDRTLTERVFWFAGAGWDRNRFAGVDNRWTAFTGAGNLWADGPRLKFRTDYAVTFTRQEDVTAAPGADDTFAGLRLSSKLVRAFGANATYLNDLVVDENLDETDDLRADMTNSLAVAINARLALKVSLQWLYDRRPALQEVPLEFPAGSRIGTALAELDELDTIFTSSLVVNF